MRPRSFFLLVAAASAAVTLLGLWLHRAVPSRGDGSAILISALMSGGFVVAAWLEGPSPQHACPRCGGGAIGGLPFCALCGDAVA